MRPSGYFDILSFVMDQYPGLVRQVHEIRIPKDPRVNYENNIYVYEGVISELIEYSSLRKLTLTQFSGIEIVRILVTLKHQKGLQYLNLSNNSLTEDHLSVLVRSMPGSREPLTLDLSDNLLFDEARIALLVSARKNVRVLRIGQQKAGVGTSDKKLLGLDKLKEELRLCYHPKIEVL